MFYKYKKYKQKYIDFKNQIGGECIISPDDGECDGITTECHDKYSLIDSLTNMGRTGLVCANAISASEILFDSVKKNQFPFHDILDIISREPIDINQIWYIIVNNNNYIHKLMNMEVPSGYKDLHSDFQNDNANAVRFIYSEREKKYIEEWLTVFKNNKIYITSLRDIDTLFNTGKLNTCYTSDPTISVLLSEYSDYRPSNGSTIQRVNSVEIQEDNIPASRQPRRPNSVSTRRRNSLANIQPLQRTNSARTWGRNIPVDRQPLQRTNSVETQRRNISTCRQPLQPTNSEEIQERNRLTNGQITLDSAITQIINHIQQVIVMITNIIISYTTARTPETLIFEDTDEVKNIMHDIDIGTENHPKFKASKDRRELNNTNSQKYIIYMNVLKEWLIKNISHIEGINDMSHTKKINDIIQYIEKISENIKIYRSSSRSVYLHKKYTSIIEDIESILGLESIIEIKNYIDTNSALEIAQYNSSIEAEKLIQEDSLSRRVIDFHKEEVERKALIDIEREVLRLNTVVSNLTNEYLRSESTNTIEIRHAAIERAEAERAEAERRRLAVISRRAAAAERIRLASISRRAAAAESVEAERRRHLATSRRLNATLSRSTNAANAVYANTDINRRRQQRNILAAASVARRQRRNDIVAALAQEQQQI